MPRPERGTTPLGFRDQLLARLRNRARELNVSVQRVQYRVAFERLLARLSGSTDWTLKGGFALELRYGWRNRPTRDVDLRTLRENREALDVLRGALGEATIEDHFTFDVGESARAMQGAPGGSVRVRVIARVAGRVFSDFHIDLSSGDVLVGLPDVMEGSDLLSFAGIEPVRFPVYPVAQHLAEKLHAYTLPRAQENTRVKDLVDLVAIAAVEKVEGNVLLASLQATFDTRGTHPLPAVLPEPPASWSSPFRNLSRDSLLAGLATLDDAYRLAARFWNPVLSGRVSGGTWLASKEEWRELPE